MGSVLGRGTVIVVDDNGERAAELRSLIQSMGYSAILESTARSALRRIRSRSVNAIAASASIQDMHMTTFLDSLRKANLAAGVLVYGKNISAEDAIAWMKTGVVDILLDPSNTGDLRAAIQKAFSFSSLYTRNAAHEVNQPLAETPVLLYRSKIMRDVIGKARRVAPVKATVLITGESGTGKDILAKEIHRLSGRTGPYTAINCSAIPETLLEDELFGHERGAFTGAERIREGKFEATSGGTLLLDEIGEIPLATQVKMLRVLEEGQITRLGGNAPIPVDVRLIAATNSDLKMAVKVGIFRQDLYYRLKVVEIAIPPLRARKADIPLLTLSFLRDAADRNGLPVPEITKEAFDRLSLYSWPGNVRQLKNLMESLLILSGRQKIDCDDLPVEIRSVRPSEQTVLSVELPATLSDIEEKAIMTTLNITGGNRTRAAEMLGIGRRTLQRKLSSE